MTHIPAWLIQTSPGRQLIDIDLTERQNYAKHFPKAILDAARLKVVELDRLLKAFEGH